MNDIVAVFWALFAVALITGLSFSFKCLCAAFEHIMRGKHILEQINLIQEQRVAEMLHDTNNTTMQPAGFDPRPQSRRSAVLDTRQS